MAESIDEAIARLQKVETTAPKEETPEEAIARLQEQVYQAENRPIVRPWYREAPAQFNQSLANILGFAGAPFIDPLTRPAADTPEGQSFAEQYEQQRPGERIGEAIGRSQQTVRDLFERAGWIPERTGPPQSIAGHIGAAIPPALAMTAGFQAAAPAIAPLATTATSATGRAIGQAAESIAQRPVTTLAGTVPGVTTGVGARELARPSIEAATPGGGGENLLPTAIRSALLFGTEMVGGFPGTMATLRIVPMPRAERFAPTTISGPILRDAATPEQAGQIARVRQSNVLDFIDRTVARTIQRAAEPGLTEAEASVRLRGGLIAARDFAKVEVNRAWNDVDLSITGAPQRTLDAVDRMLYEATTNPAVADNFPVQRLRQIQQQLIEPPGPQGSAIARGQVPLRELNEIRSAVLRDSDSASETSILQPRPNLALQKSLNDLTDAITQDIDSVGAAANPAFQPAIDYARAAARLYHERFTRGPVGDLLMVTRQTPFATETSPLPLGGAKVAPTRLARQLIDDPNEVADAVHQAATRVSEALGRPPAVPSLAPGRVLSTGDEAIRTMFRDDILDHFNQLMATSQRDRRLADIPSITSGQRGPVASAVQMAQRWIDKNQPILRAWTDTTNNIVRTVTRLNRLLQARDSATQNVVSQFMGRNAREVVRESLSAPDSAARFRTMHAQFKSNPDFLEGMQRAVIDEVFDGRGADPNTALRRMRQGNYKDALESLFKNDPDKLDRLYEAVYNASVITGEAVSANQAGRAQIIPSQIKLSLGDQITRGAVNWAVHIFGLGFGGALARTLPGMGSAGSLSIPMRMSRGMRDLVAATYLNDRRQALSIVKEAAFNPEFEAWLRDRMPGGIAEARKSYGKLLRAVRITENLMNEDVDQYISGNGRRLYVEERRRVAENLRNLRQRPQ